LCQGESAGAALGKVEEAAGEPAGDFVASPGRPPVKDCGEVGQVAAGEFILKRDNRRGGPGRSGGLTLVIQP